MILQHKYFKAFCTEQSEREDNLASDLSCLACLASCGLSLLFTGIGVFAHSRKWWYEVIEKTRSLHSGEESLLQLNLTAV